MLENGVEPIQVVGQGFLQMSIDQLDVLSIEVLQSIQSINNDVPILAGKMAVVRVYIDQSSINKPLKISGEILWRRDAGNHFLAPINTVSIDPTNLSNLKHQRDNLEAALTFRLPSEALVAGELNIEVNHLRVIDEGDVKIIGNKQLKVTVEDAPPLRIRVVGLRYMVDGKGFTPNAIHFAFFKSYLQRAYPSGQILWSQIVVDGNNNPPFNDQTVNRVHAQLAAMRSREVSGGIDPRTHYYGIVSDGDGMYFLRGQAAGIPDVPSPDVVACGPVGEPRMGFGGDTDASYADWYGAHELGHTFGRYHPGFPPYNPVTQRGQDASDPSFPYPGGSISSDEQGHVGFDVGDPNLNLPMKILPREFHHDVMTYEDRQWVSPYTYLAILKRLRQENELFA
jgi:hypothetical protein